MIRNKINETVKFYAKDPSLIKENDTRSYDCEMNVNNQLFFETLMTILRGEIISYATYLKKKNIDKEKDLERYIQALEESLLVALNKEEILNKIEDKNKELENVRLKKLNGVIMRSRIKWMEHGEKPSKYFLNLEKKNRLNRNFHQLVDSSGHIIHGQEEIKKEIFSFYSNLYKSNKSPNVDLDMLLNFDDVPKLTQDMIEMLEGPLTEQEIYDVLKKYEKQQVPRSGWLHS